MGVSTNNNGEQDETNAALGEALRRAEAEQKSRQEKENGHRREEGNREPQQPRREERTETGREQSQPRQTRAQHKQERKGAPTMTKPRGVRTYGLGSSLVRTMGLPSKAVDVNTLRKVAEEIVATDVNINDQAYGTPEFLTIDTTTSGLPCNVLVVYQSGVETSDIEIDTAYYTLIIEPADSNAIPDREINDRGNTYHIKSVAADIYSDEVAEYVAKTVADALGLSNNQVIEAGFQAIPCRMAKQKEDELEDNVRQVLFFALAAINTQIDEQTEPMRLSLVPEDGRRYQMNVSANFGGEALLTAVGDPVRSDVVITTSMQIKSRVSRDFRMSGANQTMTVLSGFLDLFYASPSMIPHNERNDEWNAYDNGAVTDDIMYCPRFVITRCLPATNNIGFGEFLVALASVTLLGNDLNWVQSITPSRTSNPLFDIGALGLEHVFKAVGSNAMIDTSSPSFRIEDFLSESVINCLYYSHDIAEAGELTWLESLLLEAAEGNREAENQIIEIGDDLTDGRFGEYLGDQSLFTGDVVRVHLGTHDTDHGKSDIRDINHVSLLNLTGRNGPDVANNYSNALVNYESDEARSLTERQRIIEDVTTNPSFDGYAKRITYNANALIALANAISDTGVDMVYNSTNDTGRRNDRVDASYAGRGQAAGQRTNLIRSRRTDERMSGTRDQFRGPRSPSPYGRRN